MISINPRTLRFIAENRIYIFLAVAFVLALVFIPDIRSVPALRNVLARASIEGIMAVGVTIVILSGQLDLSLGSVLALSGVVALGLQGDIGPLPAAFVGIAGRRPGGRHQRRLRRPLRRQLVHRHAGGHDRASAAWP